MLPSCWKLSHEDADDFVHYIVARSLDRHCKLSLKRSRFHSHKVSVFNFHFFCSSASGRNKTEILRAPCESAKFVIELAIPKIDRLPFSFFLLQRFHKFLLHFVRQFVRVASFHSLLVYKSWSMWWEWCCHNVGGEHGVLVRKFVSSDDGRFPRQEIDNTCPAMRADSYSPSKFRGARVFPFRFHLNMPISNFVIISWSDKNLTPLMRVWAYMQGVIISTGLAYLDQDA